MGNSATKTLIHDGDAWLVVNSPSERKTPRTRIFCIPHAGGSHLAFEKWPAYFSPDIEVCAVKLPGRGPRFKESAMTDMLELSTALAAVISRFTDLPFAIFGECSGSLVALATASTLADRHHMFPAQLFVAGMQNPYDCYGRGIHQLPTETFRSTIVSQGLIEPTLAEEEEVLDFFAPQIRADFQVSETYLLPESSVLSCPIVSFSSSRDRAGTEADYEVWKTRTTGSWQHVESELRLVSSDPTDTVKSIIRKTLIG